MVVFFFSSRRRHTSWPRDWSSDVCSSDLEPPRLCSSFHPSAKASPSSPSSEARSLARRLPASWPSAASSSSSSNRERSEERRGGEEGRAWGETRGGRREEVEVDSGKARAT